MSHQTRFPADRLQGHSVPTWLRAATCLVVAGWLTATSTAVAQRPLLGSLSGPNGQEDYSTAADQRIRQTHVAVPMQRSGTGRLQRSSSRTPAAQPRPSTSRPAGSSRPAAVQEIPKARTPATRAPAVQRASAESVVVEHGVVEQGVDEQGVDEHGVDEHGEPIPASSYEGHLLVSDHCGGAGCGGCGSCQPVCAPCLPIHGRLWARGEYLLWWTSGNPVPPLVTTSPQGTPREDAGVLGPTTTVLFGGDDLDTDARSGGRLTLGYWLDPCQYWGLEFAYVGLADDGVLFTRQSTGDPTLARPFLNAQTNLQDAELVAFDDPVSGDDILDGRVTVDGSSRFHTLEMMVRRMLLSDCCGRLDLLVGYRYGQLDDRLQITENLISRDENLPFPPGTTIDLFDRFDTDNDFHGAQVGMHGQWRRRQVTLELLAKLALGNTRSRTTIAGSTTTQTPAPNSETTTTPGGLLAQPTNIGVYESNEFAVMPELGLSLHYDLNCNWRASFGYTFLYWSSVMRSGEQIDFGVNTSQLPPGPLTGSPQPQFRGVTSDFWAQGLNFGLEYRF